MCMHVCGWEHDMTASKTSAFGANSAEQPQLHVISGPNSTDSFKPIHSAPKPWITRPGSHRNKSIVRQTLVRHLDTAKKKKGKAYRAESGMLEGRSVMHGEVGVLPGWDVWAPESVQWAFMPRQTCQPQLAPCDPVREKEKWWKRKIKRVSCQSGRK